MTLVDGAALLMEVATVLFFLLLSIAGLQAAYVEIASKKPGLSVFLLLVTAVFFSLACVGSLSVLKKLGAL